MAFSALIAKVERNPNLAQNIQTYFECINDDEGPITLRGKGDSVSSQTYPAGGEGVMEWTLECRSLSQFVDEEHVQNLRLIKIDVEGAEFNLFSSLEPWLTSFKRREKPAIWLSVHQPFWNKDDPELAEKRSKFWKAMRLYRYIYTDSTFSVVDQNEHGQHAICESFCEYLLTDKEFVPEEYL